MKLHYVSIIFVHFSIDFNNNNNNCFILITCRRGVKEFQFWLFTDKIVYGEMLPGIGKYNVNREILLTACRIGDSPKVERANCAFIIESPAKSFVVWTKYKKLMYTILFLYLMSTFTLWCFYSGLKVRKLIGW